MLRKKSFTLVEQAIHQVRGFRRFYQELDDKVRLSGQSSCTLRSYSRKLAQLSLHFGKLPQHVSEKELNKYHAQLARQSKTPSLTDFKHTVYGTVMPLICWSLGWILSLSRVAGP